ncbi:dopamine receptor 2-like isoform X2 [Dendronephthya gigantea]|uniref:dopamine receptor 2-like isoform X2 n=1 Tax=Dendronephthya gigantea TaxID=151771 RepID=UPI00106A3CCE|nr:dopamine receptor 2-like isoform X2 [Dendronephthya gigantea]XP_028391821.1 dopamine receptor 2-like isoform X2 [Dendronephthya gigantea]XP_028391822.1 dopamine receptor 2-like isoform X2 [Dendronephthya gigantea]
MLTSKLGNLSTDLNNTNGENFSESEGIPMAPFVTVLCFISVASVLGNSLVCLAMYQQPRLRTVMHYSMLSLAIADLLCGAIAMPAYIAKKFVDGERGEGVVCDIFRFTYFFTEYASVSSLVMVSLERMFALKYPFKCVDPKFGYKVIFFLSLAWLDALIVALLPFIPWDPNAGGPCSYKPTKWWSLLVIHKNVVIPLLIVVICYSYIYNIAMSHVETIRKENRPGENMKCRLQQWKQRRKATTTLLIVVGIFMVCWLPSTIYYYVQNICEHCFDSFVGEQKAIFNAIVKILTFANSMTNPIIYWYRSKEFKRAFQRMFLGQLCHSLASQRSSRVHSQTDLTNQGTFCKTEKEN